LGRIHQLRVPRAGAHPDHDLVRNLNGISEVCSVLSFLLQITTLTRDVNKKFKIPTVARLARAAELFVLSFGVLTVNIVDIVAPVIDSNTVQLVDTVTEYFSLFFVVGFRFYFLSMTHGAAKVWRTQRREVLFYLVFATHAAPFQMLSYVLGLDLHHAQGLWMRCTTALCLSSTIRARLHSKGSQSATKGKAFETGPPIKNLPAATPSSKLSSIHPTPAQTSGWVTKA